MRNFLPPAEENPQAETNQEAYLRGRRVVLVDELRHALAGLDYESKKETEWVLVGKKIREINFIVEREEALAALRSLCAEYGDNDWDENLHLADIIREHLFEHLRARAEKHAV